MKQLEEKRIAPYLPYGLRIVDTSTNETFDALKFITTPMQSFEHFKGNLDQLLNDDLLKPILRNLSDLTKEIEHNGEKFVPIEKLDEMYGQTLAIDEHKYLIAPITIESYILVRQLFEWHFDIFSLLEQGLAVDFNSLTKQ